MIMPAGACVRPLAPPRTWRERAMTLRRRSVVLALALLCSLLLRKTQQRLPLSALEKLGLGIGAFCGAMIGAKLPFVLSDGEGFMSGAAWFADGLLQPPSGQPPLFLGIGDLKYSQGYSCEKDTCYFSNRNSDVNPFIRYDDFVANRSTPIVAVGFVAGGWDGKPCDILTNLDAVEITFYEWEKGGPCDWEPGAVVCVNTVPVEDMDIEPPCMDMFGIPQRFFSVDLPKTFFFVSSAEPKDRPVP